jgi:hypothetical protein
VAARLFNNVGNAANSDNFAAAITTFRADINR